MVLPSEFLSETDKTAVYPEQNTGSALALAYVALGLAGEAGEVAEKIKKILRDSGGVVTDQHRAVIQKELGDVSWYWARLHRELGIDPDQTFQGNLEKLLARKERGTLGGSGDDR
jgi:NTP pyrophosphatase (non-canonical NTP hydrolase)